MHKTHKNQNANLREKASLQLTRLIRDMKQGEKRFAQQLQKLHVNFKISGINLIHYLVFRSNEIRELQEYLHHEGLSSLTNSESHTLYQVQKVLERLQKKAEPVKNLSCDYDTASSLRLSHTITLLGESPVQDKPHIMVTFSPDLVHERRLVEEMLEAGMTVARINCAHDTSKEWSKMVDTLKQAIAKTGKSCKIYMDLAGPKIRIKKIIPVRSRDASGLPVSEGKELYLTGVHNKNQSAAGKKIDMLLIEPHELLSMVQEGERIFFDDGKFEAKILLTDHNGVRVKIVRISAKKHVLKPERGINLPDSTLTLPPLTREDKKNIPFICRHADMIGYSFVTSQAGVENLRVELRRHARLQKPAIILKIERLAAIQQLPALLMKGMQDEAMGVMIARGDLAVEIGFERLSEIQEEILWICEAAHVPVIWATQVLETMNKTGYATRSEITDAAMSVRAECVMLNKGAYITKTIRMLNDILMRQLGHVNKKRYIMRPLGIAKTFIQPGQDVKT